jgi:hypothetical protein
MTKTSFIALSVVGLALVAAAPARAGVSLGADLHAGKPLGDGSEHISTGMGFKAGLGYTLPIPGIDLTPEVQVGLTRFGLKDPPPGIDTSTSLFTAMAGGRVAVGAVLKPFAYLHLGYGRGSVSASGPGGSIDASGSGSAFDVGGGLMFSAVPLLDIGAFAGYTKVTIDKLETSDGKAFMSSGDSGAKWVEFGILASLHF